MLLTAIALCATIVLGAWGPALVFAQSASPRSQLPVTQPGLSRDEGVFLITAGDGGSQLAYFIAQNTRHSTLPADLHLEQQLNPLWPVWLASRDEVMAIAEGAPIGTASAGLLRDRALAEEAPAEEASAGGTLAAAEFAPDGAPEPAVYVLQRGDNLTRLSARFATTIDAILAANGLSNPDRVYIGESLLIPSGASAAYATTAASLPVATEVPRPADGAPEGIAPTTYTVKAGDSAIRIARQFGVELDALLAANAILQRNRVYVGQVLEIPPG